MKHHLIHHLSPGLVPTLTFVPSAGTRAGSAAARCSKQPCRNDSVSASPRQECAECLRRISSERWQPWKSSCLANCREENSTEVAKGMNQSCPLASAAQKLVGLYLFLYKACTHVNSPIFHSLLTVCSETWKVFAGCCTVSHVAFVVLLQCNGLFLLCGYQCDGCPSAPPSDMDMLLASPDSHALREDFQIQGKCCWKCCQGANHHAGG